MAKSDSVYQDYLNRRWQNYFTDDFVFKHLRPHEYVPLPEGGSRPAQHQAARDRAKAGNLHLIARAHHDLDAAKNSLIFDIDRQHGIRQVLQLMQEVEQRNSADYYKMHPCPPWIETTQDYYVQTTGHGSRQSFARKRLKYGVGRLPSGRYVINHFDGVAH